MSPGNATLHRPRCVLAFRSMADGTIIRRHAAHAYLFQVWPTPIKFLCLLLSHAMEFLPGWCIVGKVQSSILWGAALQGAVRELPSTPIFGICQLRCHWAGYLIHYRSQHVLDPR